MADPNDTDNNITPFPSAREREGKVPEKTRFIRPVNDDRAPYEPVFNLPPVVKALCGINLLVFLIGWLFPDLMTDSRRYALAFVPARYTGDGAFDIFALVSPVTHLFIHAGWTHLLINIGMLMAFGSALEKSIGGRALLVIYLAAGLTGAVAHFAVHPASPVPMIGASGAISGLFGAVIMMMYAQGMMGQGYRGLLPLIAVWIVMSVFFGVVGLPGTESPIAWVTHIGGFITGLLLYKPVAAFFMRRG